MALVLFNLGCEFTFTKFRRVAAHCLVLSAGEIFATFSLVLIGLLIFGCSGSIALLLGCLAVATAPATTILFQAETDDCIPVVTRVEPQELVGVVRRSDVVHALITQRRKSK